MEPPGGPPPVSQPPVSSFRVLSRPDDNAAYRTPISRSQTDPPAPPILSVSRTQGLNPLGAGYQSSGGRVQRHPEPPLQTPHQLPLRPDSPSRHHISDLNNSRLNQGFPNTPTIPSGRVTMEPEIQASAELFKHQMRNQRNFDMQLYKTGQISAQELERRTTRTEFANGFRMHPTRANTIQSVGNGPGANGLRVGTTKPGGHSAVVEAPRASENPGKILDLHSHGNPRPNRPNDRPSFTDQRGGASERAKDGVGTHGVMATKTNLDLNSGAVNTAHRLLLYNGHVEPSRPDGVLTQNDLPKYYVADSNPNVIVSPPSPGGTTMSWEMRQPGTGNAPEGGSDGVA